MCTGTAAMENNLAVPQNAKHKVNEWPSNSSPGDTPKSNENLCPHQYWYINDHILRNSRKEKQPKYSPADEEINKMWTICAIYVIWNWKEEIQKCPWNHYAKWKEPVPKDHRKCPEQANIWWDEISGCLGLTKKGYRLSFRGDQDVYDSTVEKAARLQESIKATGLCKLCASYTSIMLLPRREREKEEKKKE